MKTKFILPFLVLVAAFSSCNKDGISKPDNLIEQDKMADVLYDITLLSAIKSQNFSSTDSLNINSNAYIFKKYQIDSLQFVTSNLYYASDYKAYKKMYEQIKARLTKNKEELDLVINTKFKKDNAVIKAKEKLRIKKEKDSIAKVKKAIQVRKADSIVKAKKKEVALKSADSIKKLKKLKTTNSK